MVLSLHILVVIVVFFVKHVNLIADDVLPNNLQHNNELKQNNAQNSAANSFEVEILIDRETNSLENDP